MCDGLATLLSPSIRFLAYTVSSRRAKYSVSGVCRKSMAFTTFGDVPCMPAKMRTTDQQFEGFASGLRSVLRQWTALNLVTLHCDARAGANLESYVLQWFHSQGEVYSDELELFFEDFFAAARSVAIEDDSIKEVSDVLHEMYCRCALNDFSKVEEFMAAEENYMRMNPVAASVNGTVSDDVVEDAFNTESIDAEGEVEAMETTSLPEPSAAPQKTQRKRRKNAFTRGSGGWNEVL